MAKYLELLNKVKESTDKIAEQNPKANLTKKVIKDVLECFADEVMKALVTDGEVATPLGSFKVKERKERKGRNPTTGEEIMIPASKKVAFHAAKDFREAVNQK